MGLFDKIKQAFDRGGVDIDIDAPHTFRWKDGVLPVAVQLTGDDEEERVITSLEFSLAEDTLLAHGDEDETPMERSRRKREVERSALKYSYSHPVVLPQGASPGRGVHRNQGRLQADPEPSSR